MKKISYFIAVVVCVVSLLALFSNSAFSAPNTNPNLQVAPSSQQKAAGSGTSGTAGSAALGSPGMVRGPAVSPWAITGSVHQRNVGDRRLSDNMWAGVTGKGLQLEGFSVSLANPVQGLNLEYMCHIGGVGDLGWMPAGSFCGSRGQGRPLEAYAIRLIGSNASKYDVLYACHLAGVGDVGPVKNGTFCGTRGQGRRVESMKVWIQKRTP